MKLGAAEKIKRGKELTPARLLALKLWEENPKITTTELDKALKEKGFEVCKITCAGWLSRFRKGRRVRTFDGKPLVKSSKQHIDVKPPTKPRTQRITVKPNEITLEQIIKAAGSVEALSLLFYQGVMEELKRRDSAFDVLKQDCLEKDEIISQLKNGLEGITRERNRILREYNETMAKLKVGTLTLDQVELRLIPKK